MTRFVTLWAGSRSLKAHLLLVMITLIWGATFVVIKNALPDISVLFFNAVRLTPAAVTLALVFHRKLSHISGSALGYGVFLGLLLGVGNALQIGGLAPRRRSPRF